MKNPYMKFQNPSMHGSEVMLCIKKLNGWTDRRTHAQMPQKQDAFFKVGGIIKSII